MSDADAKAADQVAVMEHLNQQAAAWLAGLSPRSLRDALIRRDADGRYDARDVLRWARGRLPEPELTEEEQERLLLIGDHFVVEYWSAAKAVLEFAEGLRDRYGDAGLVLLARGLVDACALHVRQNPDSYEETSSAELRRQVEAEIDQRRLKEARDRLDLVVVCDTCHRLRRGPKWVKGKPPAGKAVEPGLCPKCESGQPEV